MSFGIFDRLLFSLSTGNLAPHFLFLWGPLKIDFQPGELAQWLRAVSAVPKDLGSVPCTYMAVHTCLQLQFQGI